MNILRRTLRQQNFSGVNVIVAFVLAPSIVNRLWKHLTWWQEAIATISAICVVWFLFAFIVTLFVRGDS